MLRTRFLIIAVSVIISFGLSLALTQPPFAQEWEFRVKPAGTLKVVDFWSTATSVMLNYAEALFPY